MAPPTRTRLSIDGRGGRRAHRLVYRPWEARA
jgi:hypothetical protein